MLFRDDTHEFKPILTEIEDAPANPLAHITFVLIVATFAFFLIWSIVGTVDVVVTAPGKVIPQGHEKVVQTLESGIVWRLNVKEGDAVKKGQVLVEIDSSVASDELTALRQKCEQTELEIERLRLTLSGENFTPDRKNIKTASAHAVDSQVQLYEANTKLLATQLREKQAELQQLAEQERQTKTENAMFASLISLAQEKEKRIKPLIDIAIPRDEWDRVQGEILTQKSKIEQNEHKLLELAQKKTAVTEDIEKVQREFQSSHLTDLSAKLKEAADLQAQIKGLEFRTRKQVLRAPIDGYVDELFVHTVGGVVSPAEKILTIIPADNKCAVVSSVSNNDIGFVRPGMPVRLKVDTFDFQKYGFLNGCVSLISYDSRDNEMSASSPHAGREKKLDQIFDVFVEPKDLSLSVEGRQKGLKAGMTVVAEFNVGKRRVIEFFLYPLLQTCQEGMGVR